MHGDERRDADQRIRTRVERRRRERGSTAVARREHAQPALWTFHLLTPCPSHVRDGHLHGNPNGAPVHHPDGMNAGAPAHALSSPMSRMRSIASLREETPSFW